MESFLGKVIETINESFQDDLKDKLTPSHLKKAIEIIDKNKVFAEMFKDIPNVEDLKEKTKKKKKIKKK